MISKKLNLSVSGALIVLASVQAHATITVPAGKWAMDFSGNVNSFYTHTSRSGMIGTTAENTIQTDSIPSAIGVGGKTRQNDLDLAFQFSFFVGDDSGSGAAGGNNTLDIRQAYLTFGDPSWGTIKLGRDLGVYASDAFLSDITTVGVGAGVGGIATFGRVGSGYQYADYLGQISYQSPTWSGFQVSVGLREPFSNGTTADNLRNNTGYDGKIIYDFDVSEVKGHLWASAIVQKHKQITQTAYLSKGWDIGGKTDYAGFSVVAYYYAGNGLSGQRNLSNGLLFLQGVETDDRGGYAQLTYLIPNVGTKLGFSYGESASRYQARPEYKNKSFIVGAYHPLTKHLNLVVEYTQQRISGWQYSTSVTKPDINVVTTTQRYDGIGKAKTIALGAVMFF